MTKQQLYLSQLIGSILVIIGSAFRFLALTSIIVPITFSIGALLLIVVYYIQYHKLKGVNQRTVRLYRLMFFISLLLALAAYLMFVKDERWIVLVLIYAITSIFLSFRDNSKKDDYFEKEV